MIVSSEHFLDPLGKLAITVEILIIWLLTAGKGTKRRLKLMFQMLEVGQLIISQNNLVLTVVANGILFMSVLIITNCITTTMMLYPSLIKLLILPL